MQAKKLILILTDGMRPDAIEAVSHPLPGILAAEGQYLPNASSIVPPVTLPCHMSLFHSVPSSRHGILTNSYIPLARPLPGLFEVLHDAGKRCAFFYNWEPLRDLGRPGSLTKSLFLSQAELEGTDRLLAEAAAGCIQKEAPDFLFLYLGETDEAGHKYGWMSQEYLTRVQTAWDCIAKLHQAAGQDYAMIVTADHGGHERNHGTECKEDMTIPLFLWGMDAPKPSAASLLDIAPTIAAFLGVPPHKDWEGKNLLGSR